MLIYKNWLQKRKIPIVLLLFMIIFIRNEFMNYQGLNSVTATEQNQCSHLIDKDLGISHQTEVSQRITTISFISWNIEHEESAFTVFAVLKVKNSGDELKKVNVIINRGENEWERVFNRAENVFDIYYDFSQEIDLIIPLEGFSLSKIPVSSLQVNITLEYYPKTGGITALFTVIDSKIQQVLQLSELEVLLFPDTFYINPANLLQIHRVVLSSYYVTKIVQNSGLLVALQLDTQLHIKSPDLIGTIKQNYPESEEKNEITMVLDKNLTNIGIRFKPEGATEESQYSVKISVKSIEKQTHNAPHDEALDIPDHPIPVEIMNILLPLVLFGVPLVTIYKHQETRRGKKFQEQSNK